MPFIDVKRHIQYTVAHIPGAINLELNSEFTEEALAQHVSKAQAVVFNCSDPKCYRSAHASAKARSWGYSKAMYFSGGWSVWLKNGYERN